MAKNILSICVPLASDAVAEEDFESKVSLLDWDIIIFKPFIENLRFKSRELYQGKPCLDDTESFRVRESCEHWRREIGQAFETGKTVIVFMPSVQEFHVATGEHRYSGSGRNRHTTRIVELYSNYKALPMPMKLVNAAGSAMKLTPIAKETMHAFWAEFETVSEYKVLFPAETQGISITTRNGDRPVGAVLRHGASGGTLLLLPDIDFCPENFLIEENDGQFWTPEAKSFASRMISAVLSLDKSLRSSGGVTPEPEWASDLQYALRSETTLRLELLEAERQVEEAQKRKENNLHRLKEAGRLRALLYENGKPLEAAIIEALKIIGFQASAYKQQDSEFDVVFEAAEGRLLGEAEGKDTKAINVDKLRQLAMNIHEDLQREDVTLPAKGVMFGNGYRLSPPESRAVQFTEKCVIAARLTSTALLATTELYKAAQYLSDQANANYARSCRETILAGIGLTPLPPPPSKLPDDQIISSG